MFLGFIPLNGTYAYKLSLAPFYNFIFISSKEFLKILTFFF